MLALVARPPCAQQPGISAGVCGHAEWLRAVLPSRRQVGDVLPAPQLSVPLRVHLLGTAKTDERMRDHHNAMLITIDGHQR